jgi:hypothetical protein
VQTLRRLPHTFFDAYFSGRYAHLRGPERRALRPRPRVLARRYGVGCGAWRRCKLGSAARAKA